MRGRTVRTAWVTAALTAAALGAAGSAQAAYNPKLSVSAKPTNTPGEGMTFSSTVTQASDEEPSKAARVRLPPGVSFDVESLNATAQCTPAQRDAEPPACPANSRIGTATADTSLAGLSGGVFLGEKLEIYIILRSDFLLLIGKNPKPIVGRTEFPADGSLVTVLDDLPTDLTATRFELAFNGPPKPILKSPITQCGSLPFSGTFTSKSGVKVTSTTNVTFTGCKPPAVAISKARLAPRSVFTGRRFSALSFNLNRAAQVEISVRRTGQRKILGRKSFSAGPGAHRVQVLTHRLTPGLFVVALKATADGKSSTRSYTLRVKRKHRR